MQTEHGLEPLYNEISRLNNELVNAQRELSRKNAELERLVSVRDRFFAIAAHDLRSPLASSMAGIDLLLEDGELDEATRRSWLGTMRESLGFMLAMVNDLLDTAAMESGALRLSRRVEDLSILAHEAIASNGSLAGRLGIRIERLGEEGPFPADVDHMRMRQVLNNLLSNAVKFSKPGGNVSLSIERREGLTIIAIVDEGEGIDKAALAQLFIPFISLAVRSTSGEKNTGLGLFIARRIVETHGGSLVIESRIGVGTRVEVRLPSHGA